VIPEARIAVSGAERPIELRSLGIESDITGGMAVTTVEMTFYNPNGRVLEGDLQFPLLDGQTVTGFALSMSEGKKMTMRDAVPVDKAKGRETFEAIARRNVDPALLEVTQGSNFKLRVYPLNPGQSRVVRLTYSERLSGEEGVPIYRLPLSYAGSVEKFSLSVRASGVQDAPKVIGDVPGGVSLNFNRSGENFFTAAASAEGVRFSGGMLTLSVARNNDAVYFGRWNGKTYFLAEVSPGPAPADGKTRAYPGKVSILWDASASGAKRERGREFAFLDEFFRSAQDIEVSLQVVRDTADDEVRFTVKKGDWSEVKRRLESVVYDGATNLGAFDAAGADMYLLFSDGLDNYSETPLKVAGAPLFAFTSAPGADVSKLSGLAVSSGGALVDLTALDAPAALDAVMRIQPRVVSLEGRGVSDVILGSRSAPRSALVASGVVDGNVSGVRMVFEDSYGRRVERDLSAMFAGADDGRYFDGVPLLWASLKVESLEAEYDLNRGEIRRIGREFRMATRETSLIVLDSAQDYVRYEIDPPAELKDEYDRLRAQMSGMPQRGEQNKLERVLAEWSAREEWWKRDFPKDGIPPQSNKPIMRPPRGGEESLSLMESDMSALSEPMNYEDSSPSNAPPVPALSIQGMSASRVDSVASDGGGVISVTLRPWTPDAAYIGRMKEARSEDLYRVYLDERPDYENSVAFYLDVSHQLALRGQEALSLRVLSNLAEMNLESRSILRVLGYRLLEAGRARQAAIIFRRVLAMGEEEPQSYRDLGLAYAAIGEYQMAIDRLYDVVERDFGRTFPGIEVIALTELNSIVAASSVELDTGRIDPRFLSNRPLDLRVVLTWDSDNTDVDLHVIDPNGEETFYSVPLSYQGGRITPDNTVGYGPEEFSLKLAKPGKYRVEVNFYGHTQQMISEATTIQLDLFTRYGTPECEKQSVTMRLKDAKDRIVVGEFDVK
jgi:tetratricopeptide (TPR) repeat protein